MNAWLDDASVLPTLALTLAVKPQIAKHIGAHGCYGYGSQSDNARDGVKPAAFRRRKCCDEEGDVDRTLDNYLLISRTYPYEENQEHDEREK